MKFKRLEIGYRIEEDTKESFFVKAKTNKTDPKFKFIDEENSLEWRTFCACRDGQTVLTLTQGMQVDTQY
jgi:uncharacterized FAD-dependent dehydrogenase